MRLCPPPGAGASGYTEYLNVEGQVPGARSVDVRV